MKKAIAKIDADIIIQALKVPYGVTVETMVYRKDENRFDLTLSGEPLPVKDYKGKGKPSEIIYDPRPTWTIAGMCRKEKTNETE